MNTAYTSHASVGDATGKKTGTAGKFSGLALAIFAALTGVLLFPFSVAILAPFGVILLDFGVWGNTHPVLIDQSQWIWLFFPVCMPIAIVTVVIGVWSSYRHQQFGHIKFFVMFGTVYGLAAIPGTDTLFSYGPIL